ARGNQYPKQGLGRGHRARRTLPESAGFASTPWMASLQQVGELVALLVLSENLLTTRAMVTRHRFKPSIVPLALKIDAPPWSTSRPRRIGIAGLSHAYKPQRDHSREM